jgi:tRNA pseudouridine38-40 synthase
LANWQHFYLIRIEFLGFRYHGWQKQANYKSVHAMVDKTFDFIFQHKEYRTLGCGRTDAKVSADDYAFELFLKESTIPADLLLGLNRNLPADIRAKSIKVVGPDFNIIQSARIKEYHYHFSFGEKSHPYIAPFIRDFGEYLDVEKMSLAAKLFEGKHNFKRFASKPSAETELEREILSAKIEVDHKFSGTFAPQNSFVFKVKAAGFLRYQVRLMMGALIEVGRNNWSHEELSQSLVQYNKAPIKHIAPSSGLTLHKVEFDEHLQP